MLRRCLVQVVAVGLSYQLNIKPILDQNCVECHHQKGKSPDFSSFPFTSPTTVDQAEIVTRLLLRTSPTNTTMPPGNRPHISPYQHITIKAWLDDGMLP